MGKWVRRGRVKGKGERGNTSVWNLTSEELPQDDREGIYVRFLSVALLGEDLRSDPPSGTTHSLGERARLHSRESEVSHFHLPVVINL